ncbi:hypothetical protein C8J57DRAFT_259039 [Mycena rebaudengoi]|nr:hypothetical protein C8J57DRAFT_259039 [Mycena rebaudengoi]
MYRSDSSRTTRHPQLFFFFLLPESIVLVWRAVQLYLAFRTLVFGLFFRIQSMYCFICTHEREPQDRHRISTLSTTAQWTASSFGVEVAPQLHPHRGYVKRSPAIRSSPLCAQKPNSRSFKRPSYSYRTLRRTWLERGGSGTPQLFYTIIQVNHGRWSTGELFSIHKARGENTYH